MVLPAFPREGGSWVAFPLVVVVAFVVSVVIAVAVVVVVAVVVATIIVILRAKYTLYETLVDLWLSMRHACFFTTMPVG